MGERCSPSAADADDPNAILPNSTASGWREGETTVLQPPYLVHHLSHTDPLVPWVGRSFTIVNAENENSVFPDKLDPIVTT